MRKVRDGEEKKILKREKNYRNTLGLSWAKLKFSLIRVVDEVTVIFNSV